MMMNLAKIIFALAVALVVSLAVDAADLSRVCNLVLKFHMQSELGAEPDAQAAMEFASKWLRERATIWHGWEENKLASALEKVVKHAPCSSSSLEIVDVIANCQPDRSKVWTSLVAATREYANKCLTRDYFRKRINSEKGGCVAGSCFGLGNTAQDFLDSQFLADYLEANPNERSVHFSSIMGANCCKPDYSVAAIVKAIERKLGREKAHAKFAKDKAKLAKYLDKHLFAPCQRYICGMGELMYSMSRASMFYMARSEALADKLHKDSQDDVFRYKFCQALDYKSARNEFIERLISHFA